MKTPYKCRDIEPLLYLTDDELDAGGSAMLSQHLESCPSCEKIRKEFISIRTGTLKFHAEIRDIPDFSISTGTLIRTEANEPVVNPAGYKNSFQNKVIRFIQYSSGIAAIFLIALFIWEQSISVRNIARLEHRIQTTISPATTGFLDKITLARAAVTEQEWKDLEARLGINLSVPNSLDPANIKKVLEYRIRVGNLNDPSYLGMMRNSLFIKRNISTYKSLIK